MGARSGGRVVALQVLFGLDAAGAFENERRVGIDVAAALERYWGAFEDGEAQPGGLEPDARQFGDALVSGLLSRMDAVDDVVRKSSTNWRVERMSRVDRNVVRIGAFELMDRADVPRAVAIDEAVELAKAFGAEDSAKFVNGVLEAIADSLGRPRIDETSLSGDSTDGRGRRGRGGR